VNQQSFASAPSSAAVKKTDEQFRKELEALSKEGSQLNEQRIRIQTEIERARQEKAELEAKLLAEFGTSDLAELTSILERREIQNEENVMKYKDSLNSLREEIEAVNAQLVKIR
jgi:predicted  nucleic acid-binding Zn-ribbon protein